MPLRSNSWPQQHTDTLIKLYASGLSLGQIALKIGKSRNAVIGWANRNKKMLPPKPKKKASGFSVTAIIVKLDIPKRIEPPVVNKVGCCQFIHGDPKARHFCGKPVHGQHSWCLDHCREVFQYFQE